MIVSDRVLDVLRDIGALGWSTYEVELIGRKDEPITGYQGLFVHGRCGGIDNSRSVEIPKEYPAGVFSVWKGLYFEPSSWDGTPCCAKTRPTRIYHVLRGLR
jgi:hypothetical protein